MLRRIARSTLVDKKIRKGEQQTASAHSLPPIPTYGTFRALKPTAKFFLQPLCFASSVWMLIVSFQCYRLVCDPLHTVPFRPLKTLHPRNEGALLNSKPRFRTCALVNEFIKLVAIQLNRIQIKRWLDLTAKFCNRNFVTYMYWCPSITHLSNSPPLLQSFFLGFLRPCNTAKLQACLARRIASRLKNLTICPSYSDKL